MRVLVIGSGGMLGHMLTLYLKEAGYKVDDISYKFKCNEHTYCLDVLDEGELAGYLIGRDYSVVINCAALLVHESEKDKIRAIKLNSMFPHWLETFYAESETRVIQVSTAGVYYGDRAPYTEEDRHDTFNFYGKTKSLGELQNDKDLTVRSDFFGPDMKITGKGLFNWAVCQENMVTGFGNVFINGVTSLEFAKFIEHIIKNPISGSINLHSQDGISKADLLRKIYSYMNKNVIVTDDYEVKRNTCITSNRTDCHYVNKTYDEQLSELCDWICNHKELYSQYF